MEKTIREQQLEKSRNYHKNLIAKLNIPVGDFNIKVPFKNFHNEPVVGIFASEFKKKNGFYFELVKGDTYEPVDESDRRVYKVPFNTNFEEEFEMNPKAMFLVPLDELKFISDTNAVINTPTVDNSISKPDVALSVDDAPLSDLTIKDVVAIFFNMPVSNKIWLNDIIKRKQ
jgi:hypothetical protein